MGPTQKKEFKQNENIAEIRETYFFKSSFSLLVPFRIFLFRKLAGLKQVMQKVYKIPKNFTASSGILNFFLLSRGNKAENGADFGCAGLIIFSDPHEAAAEGTDPEHVSCKNSFLALFLFIFFKNQANIVWFISTRECCWEFQVNFCTWLR